MQHFEFAKWLKAIVIIAAVFTLALFAFVVPELASQLLEEHPEASGMYWPCLIFVWLSALPFGAILVAAWKIFKNIAADKSFCEENSALLKNVSLYSLLVCIWYFTGAMVLAFMRMIDLGIFIVLGIIIILGFAGSGCAAALSRLVLKASKLQDDSDLTI